MPPATSPLPGSPDSASVAPQPDSDPNALQTARSDAEPFQLTPRQPSPVPGILPFSAGAMGPANFDREAWGEVATALFQTGVDRGAENCSPGAGGFAANGRDAAAATALVEAEQAAENLNHLGALKPLAQLRESFILAAGDDGLWIIDQHVAHERVLLRKFCVTARLKKCNGKGY